MSSVIEKIKIRKIKDCRGKPTVKVTINTKSGVGKASSPSGTSVGKHEVVAFPKRIDSLISYVKRELFPKLVGMDTKDQKKIDDLLKKNIERIGGVISTAISLAVSKAAASSEGKELFEYLHKRRKFILPVPIGVCIAGGKHAKKSTHFQEFLSVPNSNYVDSFEEAIKVNKKMHREVGKILLENISSPGFKKKKDFEGGWVANITDEMAIQILLEAAIGLGLDEKVDIGMDVAGSSLYKNRKYDSLTNKNHYDLLSSFMESYHLYYIEDPFHEEDFDSHAEFTKEFGKKCLIVGDDLFTTNPERLKKGIKLKACNAIIIKPNQIGTLSDCYETVRLALKNKYIPIMSHRSGETYDTSISHLSVAWNVPFIKIGIVGRERISKTNELISIGNKIVKGVGI